MCHKFNTQHLALSTQTQVSYFYNLWASVIVSFLCVIFSPNAIASIKANCSPWISNDYVINSLGSTPIDACIKLMQQWTVDSAKNTCDFGTRLCPIVYTFVRYAPRSVNSCRFTTASSDPNHRPANPEYDGWGNQMYCQCSEPPYGNPSYGLTAEELTEQCGVTDGLTLTLTPAPNQKDPRPKGTEGKDGKSTLELIAKVTENGNPKAGVVVGFGVAAEPFSGGHAHGDLGSIPRPKGNLSKTSGETDLNGEVKLTFIADEPAGLHAVVADCTPAGCTNKATHVVKVKVPDLIHIPPDFGNAPARYVLIGNYKTPENPAQQINHNDTHFLTTQSWRNLEILIDNFIDFGWGQVGINDASLEWGGMFDIDGKWLESLLRPNGKFTTGGHAEHRDGQQVDISFVRPASVSAALRQTVWDDVCKAKGAGLPRILWHQNDGYAPHYHIYLTGKGVTGAPKQCSKQ